MRTLLCFQSYVITTSNHQNVPLRKWRLSYITDKLTHEKKEDRIKNKWQTGSPWRLFFIFVLWLSVVFWHMPVPERRTMCWLIWLTSDGCRGMASESPKIHRHERQALGYPKTAAASHFLPLRCCRHNTVKYYKALQLGIFLRFNCKRFRRKGLKKKKKKRNILRFTSCTNSFGGDRWKRRRWKQMQINKHFVVSFSTAEKQMGS